MSVKKVKLIFILKIKGCFLYFKQGYWQGHPKQPESYPYHPYNQIFHDSPLLLILLWGKHYLSPIFDFWKNSFSYIRYYDPRQGVGLYKDKNIIIILPSMLFIFLSWLYILAVFVIWLHFIGRYVLFVTRSTITNISLESEKVKFIKTTKTLYMHL